MVRIGGIIESKNERRKEGEKRICGARRVDDAITA
jgi:hypothetical protein